MTHALCHDFYVLKKIEAERRAEPELEFLSTNS